MHLDVEMSVSNVNFFLLGERARKLLYFKYSISSHTSTWLHSFYKNTYIFSEPQYS